MLLRFLLSVSVVASSSSSSLPGTNKDLWQPLKDLLDGWLFTDDFAVTIGNSSHGRVFTYEKGNMTLHTPVETASTSKWPIAMMLAGLVHDGTIKSFDDPVSDYLDWWTSDKSDNRSFVTLNHLLSFTSGFGDGAPGVKFAPRSSLLKRSLAPQDCVYENPEMDIIECAKLIYNNATVEGKPGTVFAYNSYHLQLAGALACSVTGLDIQQVLEKYLFKSYGMTETTCPGKNPPLAVCLTTTGHDYDQFLRGQLSYTVLSKLIVQLSETDHTPFLDGYQLYGHYGFGHFLECFDSVAGFTKACQEAHTHIDPGAYGYYPLLDRKNGYYLNLVAYEHAVNYPRSGIPEYLGVAIKPIVDAIMRGEDTTHTASTHSPPFLALSVAELNYIMGCYKHPMTCL